MPDSALRVGAGACFSVKTGSRITFLQIILVGHILFNKSASTANSMVVPFPVTSNCKTEETIIMQNFAYFDDLF